MLFAMLTEPTDKFRILQIPLPGGSGNVPTGAMQFRDDWPGLFIRGDDAVSIGFAIHQIEQALASSKDPAIWMALMKLTAIAEIIERDVRAK